MLDFYLSMWYYSQVVKRDGKKQVGIDYCEGPPVPIPNTEVKLACAHDTWLVTARDNRFSPTQAVAKYCSRFFILLSP